MKLLRQTIVVTAVLFASSCAFFNSKTVDVSIKSSPPGADIFIEGKNYGQTPKVINIIPERYEIILTKEGYGSTTVDTDVWWATARTDINGVRTSEGTRCFLDMMSVLFSFNAYTGYCSDFKQKEYSATIPYLGSKRRSYRDSAQGSGRSGYRDSSSYYQQSNARQNQNRGYYRQ